MKAEDAKLYVSPADGQPFYLEASETDGCEIVSGALVSKDGSRFIIESGIPNLTYPFELLPSDRDILEYYQREAAVYDRYLPLTFQTFGVDETEARNGMVDALRLRPDSRVLEIGCGTGRDSVLIAQRLGSDGRLFVQDLSPALLAHAVERLKDVAVPTSFAVGNGYYLAFPDNSFDAVYHFGGLNTFGDIKRTFAELVRVTKPGGRVVVGDESMPPWLRETEFGKILMNSNPHYRFELPLDKLPVEARNVVLRWIIGGVFYVFEFDVGEGAPSADFDFEIPGPRGGTHRTRYHGLLEGVAPEIKALAQRARATTDKSMHAWLNEVIGRAAREALDE
jgi:ubiquinone/menaquinone biosynthesis C-methylase UbiE